MEDFFDVCQFGPDSLMFDYSFKPTPRAGLLFALAFPLFMSLAGWQLDRARDRDAINALRESRAHEAPMHLVPDALQDIETLRYRQVWVEGEYDSSHQFLVDNQMEGQTVGYHVLTPFRIRASGIAVLVNRGWLAAGTRRSELPDLAAIPPGNVRLEGTLDRFYRVGFQLQGASIPGPGWPSVVQVPESGPLAERLGYPILPYQVLLTPDASGGYSRIWHTIRLDSGKNRGYALQWLLFAAVTVILFVRSGLRPKDPIHPTS